MKKIILAAMLIGTTFSANASVFSGDGTIGNIRQSAGATLQINHSAVVANTCSTKNYAVALETTHTNFKNIYAAVLTARAMGATVQFAVFDNQCINGFPEVEIFTVK